VTVPVQAPPRAVWIDVVRRALREDLGLGGDITSAAVVPAGTRARGRIVARAPGVVCGVEVAAAAFLELDPGLEIRLSAADGDAVAAGTAVLEVTGRAHPILAAERVALNLLGHLSGIATLTRRFVDAVAGTGAVIADTRKTLPGLRALEKHAVRCGGGRNLRLRLDDAVLVKDNHLALVGSVSDAVRRAREGVGHAVAVEVEVESLEALEEALAAGADVVLLDNMETSLLAEAVRRARGRAITEASGGIRLETVRAVAETGVDVISVGAITHSAPALDVALELEPLPG